MPFANRKQTVGTGLVHGARVAPSHAGACRLVAAWSKRHNFSRQTHNRKISTAPVRGLTTVAVPCRAAGDLLPPMCSRVAPIKLETEHVVGESVVVPGLKLTDHTFQVRCPRAVDHGFCCSSTDTSSAGHLCFRLTCITGTPGSSQQANRKN